MTRGRGFGRSLAVAGIVALCLAAGAIAGTVGFIFTLPMDAAILVATLAVHVRRRRRTVVAGISSSRLLERRALTLDLPLAAAVDHVTRTFVREDLLHVVVDNGAAPSVSAITRISWRSWGQRVLATFVDHGTTTELTVHTWPRVETTLFDWRAGERTIAGLVDALSMPTLAQRKVHLARHAALRVARGPWPWLVIVHVAGALLVAALFALAGIEGALFHYSFLYGERPPTSAAHDAFLAGYAIYGLLAAVVVYLDLAWLLSYATAVMEQSPPSLARSLHKALRQGTKDVWWGVPLAALVSATSLAVVGALLVRPAARAGLARITGSPDRRRHQPGWRARPWWTATPIVAAMAVIFVVGLAVITTASNHSHLGASLVAGLVLSGWAMVVVLGLLAAWVAMGCAMAFE